MKHWVFDPRIGDAVESNNPALIAAMCATQMGLDVDWCFVAEQADYCEAPIEPAGWRFDKATGLWYGRCILQ